MHTLALLIIPFVFWAVFRLILPNVAFEMDLGGRPGSFIMCHALYERIARLIFVASMVGVMLCHVWIGPAQMDLLASSIYSLGFMLWIALSYESYSATRYIPNWIEGKSDYTIGRYSATLALAISAIVCFAAGIVEFVGITR